MTAHPRPLLGAEDDTPTNRYSRAATRRLPLDARLAQRLEAAGGEEGFLAEALELAALRAELQEAREALGQGWFVNGATLPEAIRRKTRLLGRLPPPTPRSPTK